MISIIAECIGIMHLFVGQLDHFAASHDHGAVQRPVWDVGPTRVQLKMSCEWCA
jgi:hypothetical protein